MIIVDACGYHIISGGAVQHNILQTNVAVEAYNKVDMFGNPDIIIDFGHK
jgi:hypothetical protein